jgi:flagellar protein FlgJ
MQTPELPALRALAPLQPLQPLAAAGGAMGGNFAHAMRSTAAEITALVQNGWPQSELPSLGAEGMARRAAALLGAPATATDATAAAAQPAASPAAQRDFLQSITPWAREAGQSLGVAPELVAAHAALESGWGRRPLRDAAGGDSHNLFGIKAGGSWRGAAVQALTTEVQDGVAEKTSESFRAYPNQAAAFRDYAQLLQSNPRYQGALNVGNDAAAFAQGLARGGYATDPDYADKLSRVARQLQTRSLGE